MAAKGEIVEDRGCSRRLGVSLLTLTATLVAALGLAQTARAQEGTDPGAPDAVAESTTTVSTTPQSQPAAAPASTPAPAPASTPAQPAVSLEPEQPVTLEEESDPATKPADTPAKDSAAKPADDATAGTTPAATTPADTKPADTKPADTKPAGTKPAGEVPTGCTSSSAGAPSAGDATADAAAGASACPAADAEASCTAAQPAEATVTGEAQTESTDGDEEPAACPAKADQAPAAPVKPLATPATPPAPASTTPAPSAGPSSILLSVPPLAPQQPEAAQPEATPSAAAPAPSKDLPVAVLASSGGTGPSPRAPVSFDDMRAEEDWLGAVRALSDTHTIPANARRCVRPNGLVPLSQACRAARARAGPLLAMRLQLWPTIPASAAEINEAARQVARERDRRPARAAKPKSKPPTLEQAAPVRKQGRGPSASGGSAGGLATGSGTLRVFALAATSAVPFARPRAFRAAPGSSLVPTGELGVSLPERPG